MDYQRNLEKAPQLSFATSTAVILLRQQRGFLVHPACSRQLPPTRSRILPVAVVHRLRSSAIGRVLPVLAQSWQFRGQKRTVR